MTDKERLEEAKLMAEMLRVETRLPHDFPFDLVDWLIEQTERVQELEEHIDYLYDNNVHLKGDCRLQEQNKRYREALEFYANKINYLTFIENGKSNIEHDKGEKARKALELSDEEVSKRYFWF